VLLLASVVSVLFSDTTAVAQNETKQLSLLEQPVWSENNNSFKLSLSIKHLDEGDLIEIYTLEELNRNSLKESFISKNSEPTENSFQITLTQEQIIKKEITVELNTNSPTNNSVFSEPGTVRPLIVKSYTSDQKNSETLVFPLIHLPKTEKLNTISLAFIFQINAKPPLQHDGTYIIDREAITQITNLVETLKNNPEIKITISLPPATLSSLSQSKNPKDELLLLDIKNLAETQLHIISSPFVTSDPEAWRLIDRFETYNDLLNRGDRQLTNQLQIEPDRSFSFVANSAVIETLDALNKVGIKTFITEFSHIDPTPENKIDPFISLQGDNGKVFKVFILDDTINFYLNKLDNKNSDMQFLLGDLSLIAMDENKEEKNLIVKIPKDLSGNLLNQFLTTLQNFPKINIKALPNLVDHAEKNQKVDKTKYVLWNKSPQDISTRAPNQNLAKAAIRAYSEVIGKPHPNTSFLYELLDTTSASELNENDTSKYFTTIYEEIVKVIDGFTSPENQNVRLTSRKAELPFTLQNNLNHDANVVLILQSDGRISFPAGQTLEVKLNPGTNKIKIPVSSRASGDSQIRIGVRSPDKEHLLQLDSNSLLIRTTRLSGVGILLFVSAVFFLAFWWLRSRRLRSIYRQEEI
tara:strand:- start:1890 stop:3803 length:1914 start_codon:yes stop_codon:yes gene_type:complete